MLLVVDNSNHTTKMALAGKTGWIEGSRLQLPSAGLSPPAILRALPENLALRAVAWASVTSEGPEILEKLAAMLGIPGLALSPENTPLDFTGYPAPETIGPDRLANAVAAARRFPGRPALAIDAGTAITFSLIQPAACGRPQFLGGAIAPGLGVFGSWPSGRTARLPVLDFPPGAPAAVGPGTREALSAAAWFGARGMVRSIAASQCRALREKPAIVVTGSDGRLVAEWLDASAAFDPWLTLEGIRLCATTAE